MGSLSAHGASFAVGEAAPHPEGLVRVERVLEALGPHWTSATHVLRDRDTEHVPAGRIAHPVERLRGAGVAVCINTDDPMLFGCDLVSELELCSDAYAWDHTTFIELARTSITGSFAPESLARQLLAELDAYAAAGGGP